MRATATTWAMAMAMRLAGDKKAREGCKGNGDGHVRVGGNKESKGSKAMAMAMAMMILTSSQVRSLK